MIFFLMLLQAPTAAESAAAMESYRQCVQQSALKYAKAKEDANTTVEAALAACSKIKIQAIYEQQVSGEINSTVTNFVKSQWETTTKLAREKALVDILEMRSKNAKN